MKNLTKNIIILSLGIALSFGIAAIMSFIAGPSISQMKKETKLADKGIEAKTYCKENDFNQSFCILIDMSIHSGKKRFYVYDFKQKKVTHKYLVSHGCGNNTWASDESKISPEFSNTVDSHMSSLGKYKIGKRSWSDWGVNAKYSLHGLEESNSNAFNRWVVFHSWGMISNEETYPAGTPEGWGCPAVSNESFKEIDKLIKSQTKPTLMWIYK